VTLQKVIALIPAAGTSQRMGGAGPKLLQEIAGRTILERTLDTLCSIPELDRLVLITRDEFRQEVSSVTSHFSGKNIELITGGASRQASVFCGLEHIKDSSPDTLVLIHDAARCLVSPAVIREAISAAHKFGAVTTAVRVVDSLKSVSADMLVKKSISRDEVWAVQTPQIFRYDLLRRAHEASSTESTDDASLVEKIHPVHVVEGDRINFKITTPEDLEIAAKLCQTPEKG